ncbi:hypothetical protein RUR49_19555 [Pseudoxanthobacter sp. M-2]|uniref:hypothetical protein n=1 Tax=Pseudoxanthobacter sp. M-2 TaxID=3078754 RepID=UPI0038FCDC39
MNRLQDRGRADRDPPTTPSPPRGGLAPESGVSLGELALVEGAVGDALQECGVVFERSDVSPSDRVRMNVEMLVAERLDPRQRGVDLGLSLNEGVQRLGVVLGAVHRRLHS